MNDYNIVWIDSAKNDLFLIIEYIAIENETSAKTIYARLKKKAESLSLLPYKGRVIPELHQFNIEIYREVIEAPWRIMYRVHEKTVIILAIIDGRRDVEDIIFEKVMSLN